MVNPKPELNGNAIFAVQVNFSYHNKQHSIIALAAGVIIDIITPSQLYKVRWEEEDYSSNNWNPVTVVKEGEVKISQIHSFEWGGIMTLNPRRNKKLFNSIGVW